MHFPGIRESGLKYFGGKFKRSILTFQSLPGTACVGVQFPGIRLSGLKYFWRQIQNVYFDLTLGTTCARVISRNSLKLFEIFWRQIQNLQLLPGTVCSARRAACGSTRSACATTCPTRCGATSTARTAGPRGSPSPQEPRSSSRHPASPTR